MPKIIKCFFGDSIVKIRSCGQALGQNTPCPQCQDGSTPNLRVSARLAPCRRQALFFGNSAYLSLRGHFLSHNYNTFRAFLSIKNSRAPARLSFTLPYKMRRHARLALGQTKSLLAQRNALHQKSHISRKGAHRLFSLFVHIGFAALTSVYAVPILA